jgi:hypothetical protein
MPREAVVENPEEGAVMFERFPISGLALSSRNICVYGALRSGTTMLRLMLNAHPAVSCPGESDFIFEYLTIRNGAWSLDTDALRQNLMFKTSGMTLVDGSALDQVASLISQSARDRDANVLVMHRALNQVLDVMPDLKVIHLLRDPRDVARSSIAMGWAGNVYSGLGHWLDTEDDWSAAEPRLAASQHIEVRYEDLVSRPRSELERICAFVGVPFDPVMLAYDQGSTYSKPNTDRVGLWKQRLSQHEIGLLEARLGYRLTARGYEPSGLPLIVPTPVHHFALRLENKLRVWSRRIRDHGLVDPLTVALANRLGMLGLAHGARDRIESNTLQSLK